MKSPKPSMIYISIFHHIDISRDVTFNEEVARKKSRRCQLEEVHEEDVPPIRTEAEPNPEIVASEYHDMIEPQEPQIYYGYCSKEKTCLGKRNHTRSRKIWSTIRLHKNQQNIKSIF